MARSPCTRMLLAAAILHAGEPVRDGWLRFKLSDADYRQLSSTPDLAAIVTVDRQAGQILGVKFLGRKSARHHRW